MRLFWVIVALTAILVYGSLVEPKEAAGQTLSGETAAELWGLSWSLTHFLHQGDRSTMEPPVIYLSTASDLCKRAGLKDPCQVRALTQGSSVFIDSTLDFSGAWGRSILIHEFVHVVQNRVRGEEMTCQSIYRDEAEARMVQGEVLVKVHEYDMAHEVYRGLNLYRCK